MLRAAFALRPALQRSCTRSLQTSTAVFAKKKRAVVDAFEDGDDDLFGSMTSSPDSAAAAVQQTSATASVNAQTATSKTKATRTRMSDRRRNREFTQLWDFAVPQIRAQTMEEKRAHKHPAFPRKSTFPKLVQLAGNRAQLEQVVDLIPLLDAKYGWTYEPRHVDLLTLRCDSLGCPEVALKVFSDVPRYRMQMTRAAGQQLMHSLHRYGALDQVPVAAALFAVHNVGNLERDIVASSILAATSAKQGQTALLQGLLPEIRTMLGLSTTKIISQWQDGKSLQNKWVKTYLRAVDLLVEKSEGKPIDWLRQWRHRSVRPVVAPAP